MTEKFQQWADNRHDYAREWKKKNGGKVVGYFCTYMPEEILYAADLLPVRIFGSHEPDISIVEPHIFGMYCPVCRGCLAEGLKGRYEYLNGIVLAQSCMHMRQAFWSWEMHIPIEYSHYMWMPHGVQVKGRYEYFRSELVLFKESLEKWIGKKISDDDLDRGIDICNTNCRLLRQIYEFRKQDNPPVTGEEAMEAVLSSQTCDKKEHNKVLKGFLKKLPNRKLDRDQGTRLMIIGSEDDDREFTKMIEQGLSLPATLVIEEHCVGTRYFWNDVVPEKDRLMAIGRRYLDRIPCPSKDWPERLRFPHILNLIKEYKVEGVILMQQKFCDPHETDIPPLTKLLKENGIPTYFVELDTTVALGQFRTRLEAFLETLTMELL